MPLKLSKNALKITKNAFLILQFPENVFFLYRRRTTPIIRKLHINFWNTLF